MTIENKESNVIVNGTADADTIANQGFYATINGLDGDDSLGNIISNVVLDGGNGDDTLCSLFFGHVTMIGGSGKDSILSYAYNVTVDGGHGNDTIDNHGALDVSINGGNGDDLIVEHNWATGVTIGGGKGNDTISLAGGVEVINYEAGDGHDVIYGLNAKTSLNFDYDSATVAGNDVVLTVGDGSLTFKNAEIAHVLKKITLTDDDDTFFDFTEASLSSFFAVDGGKGNDSILKRGQYISLSGGEGNDNIVGSASYSTLDGGDGNDFILGGNYSTLIGGKGNDYIKINSGNALIKYANGDGNDSIYGFNQNTTLDCKYDSIKQSGNDVLLTIGDGSIRILNTTVNYFLTGEWGTDGDDIINNIFNEQTINGFAGNDTITDDGLHDVINGGDGNDFITFAKRTDSAPIVNGGNGDDTIKNITGYAFIDGGDGNDFIEDEGWDSKLNGGSGNDTITSMYGKVTIDGGEGNDSLNIKSWFANINGGAGNDIITNSGLDSTINGGKGNDTITLKRGNEILVYNLGDGNDTVYGFKSGMTLDASYDSAKQSGADVIVKVGDGSITFKDTSINLFNVNGNNQLAALFDESEPDPLDAILNPSAPIELGDLDRSTSNLISSIDNRFGSVTSSGGRRKFH